MPGPIVADTQEIRTSGNDMANASIMVRHNVEVTAE